MPNEYSIALSKLIKELSLHEFYLPCSPDTVLIRSANVNRPGIELNGYYEYFDPERINLLGKAELSMLSSFPKEKRTEAVRQLIEKRPPAIIITRGLQPDDVMMEAAKEFEVPLLGSNEPTSSLSAALVGTLSVDLAPRVTRHGVLVEVYGEGILLVGDSGVGKSETAIEIIKRGHRLIADDAVEIRRVSNKTLLGSAPENIRHFIELRGIGIINARRIFGIGAVKMEEKIDLCINMEIWDSSKVYDRMGLDTEYTEILGVQVPVITIPVKPGRNTAVIIEVAAMNHRQKKMGYNAAKELLTNLGMDVDSIPTANTKRELEI